jgi:hypothetical protein
VVGGCSYCQRRRDRGTNHGDWVLAHPLSIGHLCSCALRPGRFQSCFTRHECCARPFWEQSSAAPSICKPSWNVTWDVGRRWACVICERHARTNQPTHQAISHMKLRSKHRININQPPIDCLTRCSTTRQPRHF